jgi:two-component system cell cycle response regulator
MTSRILIIDDIAANARLLEAMLEAEYYVTKLKLSGLEAIEAAVSWQPDLILLDVMMPEIDGYEVARRLKAMPETAHIPIVLVTALNDSAERIRGLEAGADDFFTKPVESEVLLARIGGLVRLKRLLDEWGSRREIARALGLTDEVLPELPMLSKRALVIDDSDAGARRVAAILAKDDVEVVQAKNEAQAVDLTKASSFDVLIISLSVKDANPLRIIATLRAANHTHEIPVLLIAEPDQRRLTTRGFELGANDCLGFPVDELELRLRAKNQIRLKRYRDQLRVDVGDALKLGAVDDLTGLYNKRFFKHRLQEIADGINASLSILMIDIDEFKMINDHHGHRAGDEILRAIGSHLKSSVRASDLIARYGGEEFAVIMPESKARDANFVAERIRTTIAQADYHVDPGKSLHVTVSVGVAVSDDGVPSIDQLIDRADQALYEAKRNGRNKVIFG